MDDGWWWLVVGGWIEGWMDGWLLVGTILFSTFRIPSRLISIPASCSQLGEMHLNL